MVKPTFLLLLFVLFVAGAETDNVTNTIFSESSASNITEGESSLPWFDFRRLIGSNCIMVGNGVLPPYFRCNGCIIDLAHACVNDFKANASGNIPSTCDPHRMSEVPNTECCPRYDFRRSRKAQYKTSGYPRTLQCIKSVGCEFSQVYTDLYDNCASVCESVYPDLDIHAVCHDAFGGSISQYSLALVPILFSFIVVLHASLS